MHRVQKDFKHEKCQKSNEFLPPFFFSPVLIFCLGKGAAGGGLDVDSIEIKGVATGKYTNTLQVKNKQEQLYS